MLVVRSGSVANGRRYRRVLLCAPFVPKETSRNEETASELRMSSLGARCRSPWQDAERQAAATAEAGGPWDPDFVHAYERERREQERVYTDGGGSGFRQAAPSGDPFAVRLQLARRELLSAGVAQRGMLCN